MDEQKIYSPNDIARAMALSRIYYDNLEELKAFQINQSTAFRIFTTDRVKKWEKAGKIRPTQQGKKSMKMYEVNKLIELALHNDHSMSYIKLRETKI